jgi:hypothetical protein
MLNAIQLNHQFLDDLLRDRNVTVVGIEEFLRLQKARV